MIQFGNVVYKAESTMNRFVHALFDVCGGTIPVHVALLNFHCQGVQIQANMHTYSNECALALGLRKS